MLNSTKYLYKLTFIKCSYGALSGSITGCTRQVHEETATEAKSNYNIKERLLHQKHIPIRLDTHSYIYIKV